MGWALSPAGQRLARRHESRLLASAHPVVWRAARIARRVRPDVVLVPGLGYLVSGAELLRSVQLDGVHFTKNGPGSTGEVITQVMGSHALANMDGAGHAELRRWLQPLFTGVSVNGPVAAACEAAESFLLPPLRRGDPVDLAEVSRMAAAAAVSRLVSPTADPSPRELAELHHRATRLANCLSVRVRRLTDAQVREAHVHRDRLMELARGAAGAGEGTLAGRLRQHGLTGDDAGGLVAMVMVAGMETTSSALARIAALFTDVGAWSRIAGDPESLARAVDEGLRHVTPLLGVTRRVAEDRVVDGFRFRRGALVVGHLHAAVRDPRVISRGEDFDPSREVPAALRHLWFGAGAHFCIGMPIARALLTRTLGAIADEGGLEVVARTPAKRLLVPTYDRLVVRRPASRRSPT